MKKLLFLSTYIFIISVNIQAQVFINVDFETGEKPVGWTEELDETDINLVYQTGGYTPQPEFPLTKRPPFAHAGTYNLAIYREDDQIAAARLVSPPIDLSSAKRPELRFWRAQQSFGEDVDELWIYVKPHIDSAWMKVQEYVESTDDEDATGNWKEESFFLPDSILTSTFYIAFEGRTKWGSGVCIDDISVIEKGIIPKYVENLATSQASTFLVPSNSKNNPVLRNTLNIYGNTGNLFLDTVIINSNFKSSNIKPGGINLYATELSNFSTENHLGSLTPNGNQAYLYDINFSIPNGTTYFWITIDADSLANHGDTIDVSLPANALKFYLDTTGVVFAENIFPVGNDIYYVIGSDTFVVSMNTAYPATEKSPEGIRKIEGSIFFDSFKESLWTLNGDFEIAKPLGLGETDQTNPDPLYAISDSSIMGNDITVDGQYPNNVDSMYAYSPIFDAYYFKDIKVSFYRWLNLEASDKASIHYTVDSAKTWTSLKNNYSGFSDDRWNHTFFTLNKSLSDRCRGLGFRFNLDETDASTQKTGWNIDNFAFTGDFIANDVGVTEWISPSSGCGHSNMEQITVRIKNYGPTPSSSKIPVGYSFNGGTTFTVDTLYESINPGEEKIFTFTPTYDLSTPGFYNDIIAKTLLPEDEFSSNDQIDTNLYIEPTYGLPYSESFETGTGFWFATGTPLWQQGTPTGTSLNTAKTGTKVWGTDLNSFYGENDSSLLESPCFNLSGIRYPIFDFYSNFSTRNDSDGLVIEYSIDGGDSWTYFDTLDYGWNWNWYTNDTISSMDAIGLEGSSGGWKHYHQFIPEAIRNESSVKFRFNFQSRNNNDFYEGFIIDDIKLFEAPPDVGVSHFLAPDSACELSNDEYIKVAVKNYAVDTLFAGFEIPLALKLNSSLYALDTLILSGDLAPFDTIHFTFSDSVDMFSAGKYYLDIYTTLSTDKNYYNSSSSNDTLSTFVSVYGMPGYDLGPTIGMETIDTILDAGDYTTFDWENGDSTTRYYHVTSPGMYNVTITNIHGCVKSDSVRVIQSTEDIGVIELVSPVSDCEFDSDTVVTVKIKNFKGATYNIGDTIVVAYKLDRNPEVIDSIFLSSQVGPLGEFNYTFADPVDFSTVRDYHFSFFTILEGDLDYTNDTLVSTISTWGYPDVEIGPDVIYTSQADTITFNAGSGFDTYTWQNGSTDSIFTPTHKRSKKYYVTVTDIHGCGFDADTVQILSYDLKLESILAPVNSCSQTATQSVRVRVRNMGTDTLAIGSQIPVSYIFEWQPAVNENITLVAKMNPLGVRDYTFTLPVDMSITGDYNFVAYSSFVNDINYTNDTVEQTVSNWGYPVIDLGPDTIFTALPDTVILIANPGYATYNWGNGETGDTLMISDDLSAWYAVSVTNIHGCETRDSTYIFAHDVGIYSLPLPVSGCELSNNESIRARIWNYGESLIQAGSVIPVSYNINSSGVVTENYTLISDLNPSSSVIYTFSTTADMTAPGTYSIELFTSFKNDVKSSNDTLIETVDVYGNPAIDLGNDSVIRAISYILDAGGPYTSYLWQDSSTNQTFTVPSSGTYGATVENSYGCAASDTVNLVLVAPDLSVTSLITPVSNCYNNGNVAPTIRLKNTGTDTIRSDDQVNIKYYINSGLVDQETFTIGSELLPTDSIDVAFSQTFDMLAYDNHNFEFITDFDRDLIPSNDTVNFTKTIIPYPSVNLGNDTIVESKKITINAGANENYSYLWQDNTTTDQNYTATYNGNFIESYSVTVTDTRIGCTSQDDITITFLITDIEFVNVLLPSPICQNGLVDPIVTIRNSGVTQITTAQRVNFGYIDEDKNKQQVTMTLGSNLNSGSSRLLTASDIAFVHSGDQDVRLFVYLEGDADFTNDTLARSVTTSPAPVSNLGGTSDTLYTGLPATLTPLQGQPTYKWQDNSGNPTYTAQSMGWYWVDITGINGCTGRDSVYVSGETAIFSISGLNGQIKVYPVPVTDYLYVKTDHALVEDFNIAIYNNEGKLVKSGKIFENEKADARFDLQNLIPGIYHVKIFNNDHSLSHKIIKE